MECFPPEFFELTLSAPQFQAEDCIVTRSYDDPDIDNTPAPHLGGAS